MSVSSTQVEAVSLTQYFLFYEKWFWFLRHFYEGCFVAKERFLETWTWSWILTTLSNILHQTFSTSNPGPILCKSVESVKDLGLTINYDLSWGKHVSYIVNKANKVLGVIKRLLGNDIRHAFSCLFKSLVRPILEYAAPVWSPYQKRTDWILGKSAKKSITVSLKAKARRNDLRRPLPLTELENSGET